MQRKTGRAADRTSLSDDFAEDADNEPPLAQLLLRMDASGWWKRAAAAAAGSKKVRDITRSDWLINSC